MTIPISARGTFLHDDLESELRDATAAVGALGERLGSASAHVREALGLLKDAQASLAAAPAPEPLPAPSCPRCGKPLLPKAGRPGQWRTRKGGVCERASCRPGAQGEAPAREDAVPAPAPDPVPSPRVPDAPVPAPPAQAPGTPPEPEEDPDAHVRAVLDAAGEAKRLRDANWSLAGLI